MLLLKVGAGERRCITGMVKMPHVSPPSSVEGPSSSRRQGHGHVATVEWMGRVGTRSFKNPMLHLSEGQYKRTVACPRPIPDS